MLEALIEHIIRSDLATILVVGIILLAASEFGFRIGRSHSPERRKANQAQSGMLQGALLGLLGLLLGFTFAMAVGRFETRKQLVLDEANAIGTTWLRAGFLSPEARDTIRPALGEYIQARLDGANAPEDSQAYRDQILKSEQTQDLMWRTTVAEVKANNTPASSLFASSLNDLIDLDAKRQAASRNHVPSLVWVLLLLVSLTVTWTTGYTTALGESGRHVLPTIVLPLLLAIVITIIADLDTPRRGFIKVKQQTMIDLQQTLKKYH